MKTLAVLALACSGLLSTGTVWGRQQIAIVVSEKASSPEKVAADELARVLGRRYPKAAFAVGNVDRPDGVIRLGTPQSAPELATHLGEDRLKGPESFVVTTAKIDGVDTGLILGADPTGVMYGVYGLLERLGCGFFISFDALPDPSDQPFDFKAWRLKNHPLTPVRLVFNWHNFLSGCSGWDLKHWKGWVEQAQKSGYNTIMVHAYGNNPMFTFTFNGKEKPVGYISTSAKGRDWSVNHVNDVRRLAGGFLFKEPVFGCEAGKVPDDERIDAVRKMMHAVFQYAQQRGVKVNFAVDFDVPTCNPAALVTTLDEKDRFRIAGTWIARPDTEAGYGFYKAQAQALTELYPQLSTITLWRRKDGHSRATWPMLKKKEMPTTWQKEYDAFIQKKPAVAKLHQSVPAFGMAKVARAWRKALDELGRTDIELATGSWGFKWVAGCSMFFPKSVKLIALDYEVTHGGGEFRNASTMAFFQKHVEADRFIPVIWAQHDDGQYIGAPLRVYSDFARDLTQWKAGGFGIIHWMTHPLDIFFTRHARQTWSRTANEDLATTSRWMAERCFGASNGAVMGTYLHSWAQDMPFFARETSDFFIDRPMSKFGNLEETLAGCKKRLAVLAQADCSGMTEPQKKRHSYFVAYEKFVSDFFQTHSTFERAQAMLKSKRIEEATKLIRTCDPEGLIARYARMAESVGCSRGEEGLVVSMNTRWRPHYVRFRQQLGIEPVRYDYGPTSHDHLAQSAGIFTFHVTPDKALWQTFGQKETGAEPFTIKDLNENDAVSAAQQDVAHNGIESGKAIQITFAPILAKGSRGRLGRQRLPAGTYKLTLIMAEPSADKAGERVMKVQGEGIDQEIDIFKQAGGRNRALALTYNVTLKKPGNASVTLVPVRGKALICGATLERTVE